MANVYYLKIAPASIVCLDTRAPEGKEAFPAAYKAALAGGPVVWTAPRLPVVGERVRARINNLGWGVVVGYLVEGGCVGVHVKPDDRPEWHKQQNPNHNEYVLFGIEVAIARNETGGCLLQLAHEWNKRAEYHSKAGERSEAATFAACADDARELAGEVA